MCLSAIQPFFSQDPQETAELVQTSLCVHVSWMRDNWRDGDLQMWRTDDTEEPPVLQELQRVHQVILCELTRGLQWGTYRVWVPAGGVTSVTQAESRMLQL